VKQILEEESVTDILSIKVQEILAKESRVGGVLRDIIRDIVREELQQQLRRTGQ